MSHEMRAPMNKVRKIADSFATLENQLAMAHPSRMSGSDDMSLKGFRSGEESKRREYSAGPFD